MNLITNVPKIICLTIAIVLAVLSAIGWPPLPRGNLLAASVAFLEFSELLA